MRFAGIDFDSTAVHAVTILEATGELEHRHRADLDVVGLEDAFDRARRIRDRMPARSAWADAGVLAIGIEDPYTRQLSSLVALIRVQGALIACLPTNLVLLELRPQRWKLVALGKGYGNADKATVKAWALEQGCPAGLEQDFYDAFGIARATAHLWEHRRRPVGTNRGGP